MPKALAILEKNVEWIALGIGGAFLLWVVWAYVLTPPKTVKIANEEFAPGAVDDAIQRQVADPLKAKMGDTSIVKIVNPDVEKDVLRAMSEPAGPGATMAVA